MPKNQKLPLQCFLLLSLLISRSLSALYMISQDCDEVFNYWEPLNFLLRNFGKQTWEYSPLYAIRSWAYLLPYSIFYPIIHSNLFPKIYYNFYSIRLFLASLSFFSDVSLFNSIKNLIHPKIANYFIFFQLISPALSHSSIALLPSSFSMIFNNLALSNYIHFLNDKNHHHLKHSLLTIFWFSFGSLIGWPFNLALFIPMAFKFLSYYLNNIKKFPLFFYSSSMIFFSILLIIKEIDTKFYKKFQLVPFNIIFYNVLNSNDKSGPNIFGTEKLSYYILNLLLNFNLIAILSFLSLFISPLNLSPNLSLFNYFTLIYPMVFWCLIFFSQPHKEERFLYPIYPWINLSTSILIYQLITLFDNSSKYNLSSFLSNHRNSLNIKLFKKEDNSNLKINQKLNSNTTTTTNDNINNQSNDYETLFSLLYNNINFIILFVRNFLKIFLILLITAFSILRILSLVNNYSAPYIVYSHIPQDASGNICVGREWYRYPSSFFLPDNLRLKFTLSGFNGLLPGDFEENIGLIESISKIPKNMNNQNLFDPSKLTDIQNCNYYVDTSKQVDVEIGESQLISNENNILKIQKNWTLLHCDKLIDTSSQILTRVFYIPVFIQNLIGIKTKYFDYCLLKRINDDN
ncbi:dolichyl-P-Man:Man(6)GlcNAc(2)-PP-dolichol alpha-1,2-mannosyltransferase [Ascoidea rubescens DSM 1968]|uniref:Mannosyltransferase n=1 Tax=Ascoidea rubescens DSM 1968 TaxID=1344418 RepID=A0A1D2VM96_9ASCO|nr:glycosyltransferase family 22 protein [Ascoidea rubescens DSM 1968]ODV62733.1 glycosyltransferase family 22 protein [Ascoidea rubescens DSM 1968]